MEDLTAPQLQRYPDTAMKNDRDSGQYQKLSALLDALQAALPSLPGFRTLSLFGSLAQRRADEYSDIDLIVTTDDLPSAKAQLLGTLEQISPIEFCWAINLRPDEWNPTIIFREEGYYHKLDLGLTDAAAANRTIPDEQAVLLCNKPRPPQATGESSAYAPDHGSTGHFLLGQYLGCTRYLKARRRGQIMTCYRFAAAAMDWRLALLHARLTENPHPRAKLSTVAYRELDSLLPPADSAALLCAPDFSNMEAMDKSLRRTMEAMLEDGAHMAAMIGEPLPGQVFDRFSRFVDEELA